MSILWKHRNMFTIVITCFYLTGLKDITMFKLRNQVNLINAKKA